MASAGISVGGRGGYGTYSGAGNPYGYYGGSERVSAEDPQNQAGQSAVSGRRIYDPTTGKTSYETNYGETTEQNLATRDKYNAAAEARRQASLRALMESYGTSGAGAPPAGSAGPAFDENAARQAAFARAKDQAGAIARSSLDALREQLGNNLGGAREAAGTAQVAGGAANELGEFNRDQLMLDLNRAGETADRNYAGDLERQRMAQSYRQSLLSLFGEGKGPIY